MTDWQRELQRERQSWRFGNDAEKIILAVPVSPPDTAAKFREEVDEFVCLAEPLDFYAVGAYYNDFEQVTDEEVISLLNLSKKIMCKRANIHIGTSGWSYKHWRELLS